LPLDANVNHKSTMFGGSLYCGAVLAGWGWLHLRLREEGIEDGHIVIQEGQISYPLPVTGMRTRFARRRRSGGKRFLTMYQRYGRARLTLETRIVNAGVTRCRDVQRPVRPAPLIDAKPVGALAPSPQI
jgi:thioesterase domain-containing protein